MLTIQSPSDIFDSAGCLRDLLKRWSQISVIPWTVEILVTGLELAALVLTPAVSRLYILIKCFWLKVPWCRRSGESEITQTRTVYIHHCESLLLITSSLSSFSAQEGDVTRVLVNNVNDLDSFSKPQGVVAYSILKQGLDHVLNMGGGGVIWL